MVLIKTIGIPHPSAKEKSVSVNKYQYELHVDVEVCNETHIKLQKREEYSTLSTGSKASGYNTLSLI